MSKAEWLKRPSTALIAMGIGAVVGIFYKDIGHLLAPFGNLYLAFLKMLVIPIMVTAVVTSLGKLLSSKEATHYLKRMGATFLLSLILASVLGIGIGLIGQPGANLDQDARVILGNTIMSEEGQVTEQFEAQGSFNVLDFMEMLIPTNIFQSLVGEQNLQVLFVTIVFGVAIGTIKGEERDSVLDFFEVVFKTFEKLISWTMYGLPFGLACIIASQFATMGMDLLYSMTKLIIVIYIACILLMMISAAVIWKVKNRSLSKSTMDLKEPLLIAFGSRNSLATMPSIFEVLEKKYQLKAEAVNLVVPLSIIICRYSMILVFSIGTLFIAQLYNDSLSLAQMILILFGSIFAAIAGAGAPMLVSVSMITLILTPLGLPSETAIVLLLAVIPIIDPILTMLNVHLACSTTIIIDGSMKESMKDEKNEITGHVQAL